MKVLYKNKLIDGNIIIKNDLIEKVVIDSLSENNEEKNITNGQKLFVVLNTKNEDKDISFKTNFKEQKKYYTKTTDSGITN